MTRRRSVGELEIEILNLIRSKKTASVHDVCNAIGQKPKYTTVMTVMHRLFEKGELCRKKEGRLHQYWINDKNKKNQGLLSRLKEKVFGGRSVEMVSYLLEMDEGITKEELDQLESIIEKHRQKERS